MYPAEGTHVPKNRNGLRIQLLRFCVVRDKTTSSQFFRVRRPSPLPMIIIISTGHKKARSRMCSVRRTTSKESRGSRAQARRPRSQSSLALLKRRGIRSRALRRQRRIQVCTLKPPNVPLRTGQPVASYLNLPDPKQQRSWLYLEVSSSFGSQLLDG